MSVISTDFCLNDGLESLTILKYFFINESIPQSNIIWYHKYMDEILLKKTFDLKKEIDSLPEVIELKKISESMKVDKEVQRLVYNKDLCATKFNETVRHFGEDSAETKIAQKALFQAKLDLDNNALVKEYNKQYKIVKKIYGIQFFRN